MNNEIEELVLKLSPGVFAYNTSCGNWKMPLHLSLLDDLLAKCARGEITRLIVNMPPRHGKSELVSKYYPFWYLLNFPDKRVMLTSYSASFAESWGKRVRDLITAHGKKYGIEVSKSSRAAGNFLISGHEGGMSCAGAGGSITGKGADLLIIDDPVKNDAQAHSQVIRDKIWEWYKATALTRVEPKGSVVVVMTRWHEDDICGRIIQTEKVSIDIMQASRDEWLLLKLPAIAESDDLLGRKIGEPLWKERFSLDSLRNIRRSIGEYWFSALYQQSPSPAGGGIFKKQHFKYYSQNNEYFILKDIAISQISKEKCRIAAVMDLAISKKETADYTVMLVFAHTPCGKILVIDVLRERFDASEHLGLIEHTYSQYLPSIIGIEAVQYQTALVQSAMKKGYPIMKLKPDKDKISRALPIAARMEAGEVFFLQGAAWLDSFTNELLAFPNGKHDDQTDAFAYISTVISPISSTGPVGISRKSIMKGSLS